MEGAAQIVSKLHSSAIGKVPIGSAKALAMGTLSKNEKTEKSSFVSEPV